MAAVRELIRALVSALTRATRTARPRHYVRSSWRSRSGSERTPRRSQVAFRRLHEARPLRLKQSRCRQSRGLPFHPARTALGHQSIGSNRWHGLTISTVHGSARSMLTVTRSRAYGCPRSQCHSELILGGTSIGRTLVSFATETGG